MERKKILCIAVPQVPHYVNSGHSLPLFEVAAYIRKGLDLDAIAIDASKGDVAWMDIARLLHKEQFNVVAIMHDLGSSFEGLKLFIKYCRSISHTAKLIIFGRQVTKTPIFYQRYDVDAIVESGDYEAGVRDFIRCVADSTYQPMGITIRNGSIWTRPFQKGEFLPATEWVLPDIKEVNYSSYDRLYARDENKNCGIPNRRELVVPIARGCPIGCEFCEVWKREGLPERRLPINRVIDYITSSFAEAPFEYVSFYAPTFSLKKEWVKELSNELIKLGSRHPWKCTTALPFLDKELIELMAKSGCVRISVGLETLGQGRKGLPVVKRVAQERLCEVALWCKKYGVELNCFVILGLPSEMVEDSEYTAKIVRRIGGRYRPTAYERVLEDSRDITEEEILFNAQRRFFTAFSLGNVRRLNCLLFEEESPTQVMGSVPQKKPIMDQSE